MDHPKIYPRVLVVALGRINKADTYNNGLFLRNLFGSEWPRENIAQVYSSGDTGDRGFFGSYYCLGAQERFLGALFYRLKNDKHAKSPMAPAHSMAISGSSQSFGARLKRRLSSLLIDTGVYELIFPPRLSSELLAWVDEFKPDVILAQGYNLTFSWLPLMLKHHTGAKLAVLATDDWPKYQYAGMHGEPTVFKWLVRPFVKKAAQSLFAEADCPFAFGTPMAIEYEGRYRKSFAVLNHSDDESRFHTAVPLRVHEPQVMSVVAIGTFNKFRYPLILDLDDACLKLNDEGVKVRGAVFSSSIDKDGRSALAVRQFIDVFPDPGNEALPSYLKGADVLLLAEGFDESFVSAIELSISSKAHMFMFSRRPIIVYAGEGAGIAKYAKSHGWAKVITSRSADSLTATLKNVLSDLDESAKLVKRGSAVAKGFHTHVANRSIFLSSIVDKLD